MLAEYLIKSVYPLGGRWKWRTWKWRTVKMSNHKFDERESL